MDKKSEINLGQLAMDIHQSNVDAGWWTDIKTGSSYIDLDPIDGSLIEVRRNVGELLCLVISEVSEAFLGHHEDLMDDKLPHRKMFIVEMADTAIRLLDIIGAFNLCQCVCVETMEELDVSSTKYRMGFMSVVLCITDAMEGHRKGNQAKFGNELARALKLIIEWCADDELGIVIKEKWDFNKNRADHKLENRLKPDGKKY